MTQEGGWPEVLARLRNANTQLEQASLERPEEFQQILDKRMMVLNRLRSLVDTALADPGSVDHDTVGKLVQAFEESLEPLRKLLVEREVLRHQLARSHQNRLTTEARDCGWPASPRVFVSA